MTSYDYDLIVIGDGSGGISSANLGKNLGKKVALVKKERIDGDCTWYGCVPSKALIKANEVAYHVKTSRNTVITSKSIALITRKSIEQKRIFRRRE